MDADDLQLFHFTPAYPPFCSTSSLSHRCGRCHGRSVWSSDAEHQRGYRGSRRQWQNQPGSTAQHHPITPFTLTFPIYQAVLPL